MLSTSWAGRRLERLKNVLRNFRNADHVFGLCEYRGAVLTHEFGVTVHHLENITHMWQRRVDLKKQYTADFLEYNIKNYFNTYHITYRVNVPFSLYVYSKILKES